jgi:2-polyprenyl-6-methoxyphenol hydroxylase-like FAD-dependent oxidoreductase
MKIACVGGGPAGLYFATLMKQRDAGHDVVVYERQTPGTTYGWGVVYWDDLLEELTASDPETAQAIHSASVRWSSQVLDIEGRRTVHTSRGGFSIGRHRLLEILARRASSVGVRIEYGTEVGLPDVSEADVIVAVDGAGSRLREQQSDRFGTDITDGANKYIWLGTSKVLDGFTFSLMNSDAGWIWFHGYAFSGDMSTCVVECSAATWAGLGFDRTDAQTSTATLSSLFTRFLDGHPLINRNSSWLNFRTVTNDRWHHDNIVLAGDAAHTTHFTIGSGTRLALEDSISLAQHLGTGASIPAALEAYELQRRSAIVQSQSEARFSARWFENIERYVEFNDEQLFTLLRERRSPLLARIPPRWYYELHHATERFDLLGRVRRWAGPRARAAYSRRFG